MDATSSAATTFFAISMGILSWFIPMLAALFLGAGGGKFLKPHIGLMPRLKIVGLKDFVHHSELTVWRLAIKNIGNDTARNVQVDVVEIWDNEKKRQNFLPVPLRWTHLDNEEKKDISPDQTVYLDVLELSVLGKLSALNCGLRLGTRFASGIPDFTDLKNGTEKLTLKFFSSNMGSMDVEIYTEWNGELLVDAKIKGGKWKWKK